MTIQQKEMLTHPDDVRAEAQSVYTKQFRKRVTQLADMSEFWKDIYAPRNLYTSAMADLNKDITLAEWTHTIKILKMKSAPSPSGLDYKVINQFSTTLHEILLQIINISMISGTTPSEWRKSLIKPIPKPQAFNYDMNNTRPIALLDFL
jgi:hypothetical protein